MCMTRKQCLIEEAGDRIYPSSSRTCNCEHNDRRFADNQLQRQEQQQHAFPPYCLWFARYPPKEIPVSSRTKSSLRRTEREATTKTTTTLLWNFLSKLLCCIVVARRFIFSSSQCDPFTYNIHGVYICTIYRQLHASPWLFLVRDAIPLEACWRCCSISFPCLCPRAGWQIGTRSFFTPVPIPGIQK